MMQEVNSQIEVTMKLLLGIAKITLLFAMLISVTSVSSFAADVNKEPRVYYHDQLDISVEKGFYDLENMGLLYIPIEKTVAELSRWDTFTENGVLTVVIDNTHLLKFNPGSNYMTYNGKPRPLDVVKKNGVWVPSDAKIVNKNGILYAPAVIVKTMFRSTYLVEGDNHYLGIHNTGAESASIPKTTVIPPGTISPLPDLPREQYPIKYITDLSVIEKYRPVGFDPVAGSFVPTANGGSKPTVNGLLMQKYLQEELEFDYWTYSCKDPAAIQSMAEHFRRIIGVSTTNLVKNGTEVSMTMISLYCGIDEFTYRIVDDGIPYWWEYEAQVFETKHAKDMIINVLQYVYPKDWKKFVDAVDAYHATPSLKTHPVGKTFRLDGHDVEVLRTQMGGWVLIPRS